MTSLHTIPPTHVKEFKAYNSTTAWLESNTEQAKSELQLNTVIECSGVASALRLKILEAEILRDLCLVEAANRIGFPVNSYNDLCLILQRKPFWNNSSNNHKCSGTACTRCKVCDARSTDMNIDEFIAYRSSYKLDSRTSNLDNVQLHHQCGKESRDEVEFTDSCKLRTLDRGRIYESFRESKVTVLATACWFMCIESGMLHYCKNEESCSKMSLEIHEGSPISYSCALTGLMKRSLLESWTPWDGVNFYSAARIHSIQNNITSKQLSAIEDAGDEAYDDAVVECDADEPTVEFDSKKQRGKSRPTTEEQELLSDSKRRLAADALVEDQRPVSKRKKVSHITAADEATELIAPEENPFQSEGNEEDDITGSEEENNKPEEEEAAPNPEVIQKTQRSNTMHDFTCYEVPVFDIDTFVRTLSEMAKTITSEELTIEEKNKINEREISNNPQRFAYGSQKFSSKSRDTSAIFHRLRRALRMDLNRQKLQVQNSAVRRDTISASGVSQPLVNPDGSVDHNSCFEVSERDFFSSNYQMTKQEKIAAFLIRGTLETAHAFVRELISPLLKTKIALLVAERSAKSSNVFVAEMLNRYDMPLMSAVSFWMENMSKLIDGPIYFSPVEIDESYYAQVIVAHWREFVLADYMEELLTERKKKKTKQMDFSLFAVGVLYSMAAGGVLTRPLCQDHRVIPELFQGTTVYRLLINGRPVCELPDASAELKDALLAPQYLAHISDIYSRGYRFDEKTLMDGKQVFRLCYTYRHRNARTKLFAKARQAVYTSEEEKNNIARQLYNQYLEDLRSPHSKAGCRKTTKESTSSPLLE